MFRRATAQDKRAIFDLYVKSQSHYMESQDDYFNCSFISNNTVVNEVNGHVVSSIQANYEQLVFNDLRFMSSILFGQFFDKNKGIRVLDNLRGEVIKQESYKTLFTLVATDNIKDYQKYGFDLVYYKRVYNLNRKDFSEISYSCVSKDFNIDDLLKVYKEFTKSFTGYFYRDRDYYVNLIDFLGNKRGNLAACYDDNNNCVGYMIYFIESNKVTIKEIIYLNGYALTKLLSYALRIKDNISVYVSANEDLNKVFSKASYKKVAMVAVKVNDYELFNKLFSCKVTTALTAFKQDKKPLFISDVRYM